MKAAGLLPILLGGATGRTGVARRGFGAEKAERVKVAAAQRSGDLGLDHGVGARGSEAQRDTAVADVTAAIDHRPLVQPEAVQLGRTPGGRSQQPSHERDGLQPAEQMRAADRGPGPVDDVAPAVPVSADGLVALQRHPVTGMPAAQLAGPQAVVAEQEVPHRMRLTDLCPLRVRGDESLDPPGVSVSTGHPLLGIQPRGTFIARLLPGPFRPASSPVAGFRHALSRRARDRPGLAPGPPARPSPPRRRRAR